MYSSRSYASRKAHGPIMTRPKKNCTSIRGPSQNIYIWIYIEGTYEDSLQPCLHRRVLVWEQGEEAHGRCGAIMHRRRGASEREVNREDTQEDTAVALRPREGDCGSNGSGAPGGEGGGQAGGGGGAHRIAPHCTALQCTARQVHHQRGSSDPPRPPFASPSLRQPLATVIASKYHVCTP